LPPLLLDTIEEFGSNAIDWLFLLAEDDVIMSEIAPPPHLILAA
jgi:hypothetical protein